MNEFFELKSLKEELKKEDIEIIGVFGSFARGEENENSDVDILYKISNPESFYNKNRGFNSFTKLSEIKSLIASKLKRDVDFVAQNSLSDTAKRYIFKDLIYV